MKLLYILGSSRCGSTILGNVLGEVDGFFSAGEVRFLWERRIQERRCGCGSPVAECPVWGAVLERTGRLRPRSAVEVVGWQRDALRLLNTPRLLRTRTRAPTGWPALDRYLQVLDQTYAAVVSLTGSRVIVDASKRPADAAAVRLLPGVDVRLLHLIRDPRAVAYSRSVWKLNPDRVPSGGMGGIPIRKSIVHWSANNVMADLVRLRAGRDRSRLLRYEDLTVDPRGSVRAILRWLGALPEHDPFVDDHTLDLGLHHTVSGNPDRFKTGRVEIGRDDRWRTDMPAADRLLVTCLTLPFLVRYRYPISHHPPTEDPIRL